MNWKFSLTMTIKTLKATSKKFKIPNDNYAYQMGMIGENKNFSFMTTCKEEMFHVLGKAIGWEYDDDSMFDYMGQDYFETHIDMKNPTIFLYVDKKLKYYYARRIKRVLNMLADRQKLKHPTVWVKEDGSAIFIRPDKWYFRNSLAVSGLLTFMRGAAKTDFVFQNLNCFITKLIQKSNLRDGKHLKIAKHETRILNGFLDKNLRYFKFKPQVAYRTGRLGNDIFLPGIAIYNERTKYTTISKSFEMFDEAFDDRGDIEDDYDDF